MTGTAQVVEPLREVLAESPDCAGAVVGLGVEVGEDILGDGRVIDGYFVAPVDRDVRDGLGISGPSDQFDEALHVVARVGAGEDSDSPSRTTLQRILGRTEAENWSRTEEGRYQRLPAGSCVLGA